MLDNITSFCATAIRGILTVLNSAVTLRGFRVDFKYNLLMNVLLINESLGEKI